MAVHLLYFNPRSREGSDSKIAALSVWAVISIHAPAKGATDAAELERLHRDISIHAPAKGATHNLLNIIVGHIISIHAPAKGAT